ncbi:MAG TPA: hypothetical protein VF321_00035 [Gaiellaceae bacterium]
MALFGRREPLHERLLREAGLSGTSAPVDPRPVWQEMGVHGIQRAREWDATVTADAPDIEGDMVRFVTLPDGTLLVEDGPDDSLEPLATAVEQAVPAPYRARAARQKESLWAIQARRIEVVELPDGPEGDAIDLTHTADGSTLAVDGARIFGSLPRLDELGARVGREFTVHAERLEGDLWEVRATAL